MKVFEVLTEHCEGDSKEIITTRQYVTAADDTLKSVVDHFTTHCEQYEMDLKGVREVLVVAQKVGEEPDLLCNHPWGGEIPADSGD